MTVTAAPVGPQRYHERYPAKEESIPRARHDVALALETWGLSRLVDMAGLVVSELVTNAVEHTDVTTVGASVTRTGPHSVRIIVTDTSRVRPTAETPNGDEERGRGLQLVEAAADDWGAELVHGGKRVWAHLTAEASP
ncbi:ATP-binding protein [Streptomyces sp. N50]|uniref:ATP-binding protein n=1 Tax=Streptomyces sp. N50 TaxID=3081765 RepID=UPI002961F465|nr:ATP-binding protein [Streptomyces sp. N50]WOX10250.1 ATP-binding protein [Streptomyces sp. N50]